MLEEAGHISTQMIKINIVPMMMVKNTALIAISTPGNEDGYYAQMDKITDPSGEPYFKFIALVSLALQNLSSFVALYYISLF